VVIGAILMLNKCSAVADVSFAVLTIAGFVSVSAFATTYYVSSQGSDVADGKTPATAWQTMARVNTAPLKPGDTVLFRRGDAWRGQLVPRSGDSSGYITYGAYGVGDKPVLLGSIKKSRPGDWRDEGRNIWSTLEPNPKVGAEQLANPSFSTDASGWGLYYEHGASADGARDTSEPDSPPAAYRMRCMSNGKAASDIQFYTGPLRVAGGSWYRLTFRAKCTTPFDLHPPVLIKNGPPWDSYGSVSWPRRHRVDRTWRTYSSYYRTTISADDARLDFCLGGSLPAGSTLHIDSLSFAACDGEGLIPCDVGNLIFDKEASCGVKVFKESDLTAQGRFWYDQERHLVRLYSAGNPGSHYSDIECALHAHIIDESNRSYVIYENLALKYGGAHGIGGANTHHIIVRDCDLSFIGGANQMGGDKTVRFGNGIEFWANAHDCLVERCRLWEIYDAALTHQRSGPQTRQYNITDRNNVIWNCEYSFEYWNRPEDSETHHIRFENNTCYNAGHCWGHAQRPDPSGRHLCFYNSPAAIRDFVIRNNIFFEAKGNAFYAPGWTKAQINALTMNHNCWYQAEGTMISIQGKSYAMAQFGAYQSEWNTEPNSIVAKPLWVDPAGRDFHLTPRSPCVDAGTDVGIKADIEGTPVPQGVAPDMGAFELRR